MAKNQPAFPESYSGKDGPPRLHEGIGGGMSLRDYFAAAALQGLLMSDANEDNVPSKDFIITAYDLADAMLKEREEERD